MDNNEENGVWVDCYKCQGTGNVTISGLFGDSKVIKCSECNGSKRYFVKQSCPFTDRLCREKFCTLWEKDRCLIKASLQKYMSDWV